MQNEVLSQAVETQPVLDVDSPVDLIVLIVLGVLLVVVVISNIWLRRRAASPDEA